MHQQKLSFFNQTKETDLFSNINCIQNNDSLVSFENHELSNQGTPSQFNSINQSIVPNPSFNASEINKNSTPFVTHVSVNSNEMSRSGNDYKEKFKKYLNNLNTSELYMFGDVTSKLDELSQTNFDQNASCYAYSNRVNHRENVSEQALEIEDDSELVSR